MRNCKPSKLSKVAKTSKTSRYIPQELKRAIFQRDCGQCQYVDSVTGNKCGSKYLIQIDHHYPFSKGGQNTLENLHLLCAAHNQLKGNLLSLGKLS